MPDRFQEGLFAPTLRAKMVKKRKRKLDDDAAESIARAEEQHCRKINSLRSKNKTPQEWKAYNDYMARKADGLEK